MRQLATRVVLTCMLLCALHSGPALTRASDAESSVVEVELGASGELQDTSQHIQSPRARTDSAYVANKEDTTSSPALSGLTTSRPTGDDTRSTPRAIDFVSTITLIKELEEIDHMIKLQERKLALLEKVRVKTISEQLATSSSGSTARMHAQHTSAHFADALDRKLEALTASAAHELLSSTAALERAFDTLFFPRAALRTTQRVVDIKIAAVRAAVHLELIAVALADGAIEFYISPQMVLLLRIAPTHDSPDIHSIDLDLLHDPPSLAVLFSASKRVVVYALVLTHYGHHLLGKRPDEATTAAAATHASSAEQTTFTFAATVIRTIQLEATPAAMAITKSARRSTLSIASDADGGSIDFYALNGTRLHRIATHAAAPRAIATHRNRVAISNDSDVVLVPLVRNRDAALVVCTGSMLATVTSIALDPVHTDLLYAGTSRGEVLVFAIADPSVVLPTPRSSSSNSGDQRHGASGTCTLVARQRANRMPASDTTMPTAVHVHKDHVIAASGSVVAVYNATRTLDGSVSLHAVCAQASTTRRGDADAERSSTSANARPRPLLAVSDSPLVSSVVVVNHLDANGKSESEIVVLQSLLTNRRERDDASYVSLLFVAGVIVSVMLFQFCFRRQQQQQRTSPADMESWRSAMQDRQARSHSGRHDSSSVAVDDFASRSQEAAPVGRLRRHVQRDNRLPSDVYGVNDSFSSANRQQERRTGTRAASVDADRFGAGYDMLSDDLKRKIAAARHETLECSFDDDIDDYEEDEGDENEC